MEKIKYCWQQQQDGLTNKEIVVKTEPVVKTELVENK